MNGGDRDVVDRLLRGAVDPHSHPYPSPFPRRIDIEEAARQYEEAGFRAFVAKSHHHSTATEVALLERHGLRHAGIRTFGAIALNNQVGGLNPHAVNLCLAFGGKVVWFPTIASPAHIEHAKGQSLKFPNATVPLLADAAIDIFDDGKLKPEVHDILGMVAEEYPIADEGQGARDFPPLGGHADLSWHILRSLIADDFDVTVCQEMEVDHGVISPLPMIDFSHGEGWRIPIVPFVSNVILHPLPRPQRFYDLGKALRRAILSYPEDLGVVIAGTGGLSHQLTGTAFGTIHEDWDREFLKLLAEEPERLCSYSHEELMKLGGTEGVEVVQWLFMRAALPADARPHIEAYYPHRIMGYGLQAYDCTGSAR